jgi:hypothetical protein
MINKITSALDAYDKHLKKRESFDHQISIDILKNQIDQYKRFRDRSDRFQEPDSYKLYANRVREINETIKYLQS